MVVDGFTIKVWGLTVVILNLGSELVLAALQDRRDLSVLLTRKRHLQLDHADLVPGVLESGPAAGDDVQPVLQELDGRVRANGDGDLPFLGSLGFFK